MMKNIILGPGTFYSTHSFVCYFLVRQRPFTEIHLETQDSKFDAPARIFIGVAII